MPAYVLPAMTNVKSKGKINSNFVTFLENLNCIWLLRLIDLGSPRQLTAGHD